MNKWSEEDIINTILLHGNNCRLNTIIIYLAKNNTVHQIYLYYVIKTMIQKRVIFYNPEKRLTVKL